MALWLGSYVAMWLYGVSKCYKILKFHKTKIIPAKPQPGIEISIGVIVEIIIEIGIEAIIEIYIGIIF